MERWLRSHLRGSAVEGLGTDRSNNYDVTDWGEMRLSGESVNALAHPARV